MATAPSPNDLTRQQLDELDALLQRMLSLPLTPADTPSPAASSAFPSNAVLAAPPLPEIPAPPPPVKNWRVDPPAPVQPTVPYLAAATVTAPPPAPEPHRVPEPPPAPVAPPVPPPLRAPVSWVPEPEPEPLPPPTPQPAADAARPAPKPAPVPVAAARPLPVLQPKYVAPLRRPAVTASADEVPALLRPVAALNGAIELLLGLFGPPGRLLRSGLVKNLLGLSGIGLLIYTAAHVAQIGGWVSLPVRLPWPR